MSDLLSMRMVPILNGNDATASHDGGSVRREESIVTMATFNRLYQIMMYFLLS